MATTFVNDVMTTHVYGVEGHECGDHSYIILEQV
jgi:hypothetical protein